MNKTLVFLSGMATGIVLFIIITSVMMCSFSPKDNNSKSDNPKSNKVSGLTIFPELGECISTGRFEVISVLSTGHAIAVEQEWKYNEYMSTGIKALILCDDGVSYYDGQIIKAPAGKCFRQTGTYKYLSQTLPAVIIDDKK